MSDLDKWLNARSELLAFANDIGHSPHNAKRSDQIRLAVSLADGFMVIKHKSDSLSRGIENERGQGTHDRPGVQAIVDRPLP